MQHFFGCILKIETHYLADGETEAQKGKMTCPEVSQEVTNRANN